MNFSKAIDLEDFYSQELKPYLQELAEREMALFAIEKPKIIPDSKNWETAMALHSFDKHDLLKEGNRFAGIGAGTEQLTELLANRGAIVFPVDRYLEQTAWSDVAPGGYMVSVSEYTQTSTNARNIIPVHSDGRVLNLPSDFFDGVYSSGSIEHFGSLDAVEAAAAEIARILKPGGIASISTEFRLDGPEHTRWFDDNCILFTQDLLAKHVVQPSGLIPLGIPDNRPSSKTFETRKCLTDFLSSTKNMRTFEDKTDAYPNLILYHEGFLFCSVHILLKKPVDWEPIPNARMKVDYFRKEVQSNQVIAIARLKRALSGKGQAGPIEQKSFKRNWLSEILKAASSFVDKRSSLRRILLKILIRVPKLASFLRRKLKENE
jgi:SAM-dependent methyltransferase